MIELEKSPLFEPFVDPQTGVRSYILKEKPADCVQSFYFCNQSLSADQKYLWMYCFFPPLPQRCLGVVSLDPADPFVRVFKEAVFFSNIDPTPLVAPEGNKVYFVSAYANAAQICTVDIHGHIEEFARMPREYIGGRTVFRFGTHLSISADGKYMLVDAMIGSEGCVAVVDMETREFRVINEYEGHHDHGQFSPTDPELFLLDQDGWDDPYTGKHRIFHNRMWLCDRSGTRFEPVIQKSWFNHDGSMICHDFWSDDGRICWIDYHKGAFEMDAYTREMNHVWKHPMCHAHCNRDRSLWVADQTPYGWKETPCRLMFFNRNTGRSIDIFSAMPAPIYDRAPWHIDPHPQFSADGQYILATTTVRNQIDISITPVAPLMELTSEHKF